MRTDFIEEATRIAESSSVICASHGAVVIYRGKIIGRGCNKYCLRDKKRKIFSIHAEVSAVQDALRRINLDELKKTKIIIVRINNDGEIKDSFPCEKCRKYLIDHGIRNIYYS
tara:strand:+ start:139 stop:477 length:339 start_codon:yes stop_codon:yes gene_type:complete